MVEIHMHDMFSFLDGFGKPEEMMEKAREVGLKGLATTNHGNQFSWVYYAKLQEKYPDVKILYGVEMYECFDKNIKDANSKYFHLIVIAKNERGRKGINELITISNQLGFYKKPRIELKDLEKYAEDLIISSACLGSKIAKAESYEKMKEYALEYKNVFPHFFLEMQSHNNEDQIKYNKTILKLSRELDIPYVITTDAHRANKEDLKYQQMISSINKNKEDFAEIYDDCYIKGVDETLESMIHYMSTEDIMEGIENSDSILEIVEDVKMPFQDPKLPSFNIPNNFKDANEYLRHLCMEGFKKRKFRELYGDTLEYKKRIERFEYEFKVITTMGFSGYFLIVWDFVNFCMENEIMVGAGRGSAAGCLISYLLGITDIDPITHGLIFERFLNPERVSFPDIDVDVSDRQKVIGYLEDKYGIESVCQVANFSYITPKVAIKDSARALKKDKDSTFNLPLKKVEDIAKLFVDRDFDECIESTTKLKEVAEKEEYREWFDMARKMSGRVRNTSTHACAIGIVSDKINNYMGMFVDKKQGNVIQVDKRILEEIGIVKMDLLGLNTLSVIKETLDLANKDKDLINPNKRELLENKKMFDLLQEADSVGVFQVESYGMQELLMRMKPSSIGDISAVLALYRPDTMDMIEDYIERKHGRRSVEYIHPDMKPILEDDFGCLVYQEQLLEIVRKFGGRTYGGADKFRKGIGKKDKELVKKESEKLYQEIVDNGYSEIIAKTISDEMSEKGGYSFNKSHSLGYAVLTLQTAYLKANYPVEFMTALLNSTIREVMKDDKVKYSTNNKKLAKYIADTKKRGIDILPPKINKSEIKFSINKNNIIYGLMLVKGVGNGIVPKIVFERNVKEFSGFEDFFKRIKPTSSNFIALTKAGCFCRNEKKRDFMIKNLKKYYYNPTRFKKVKSVTPKQLRDNGLEVVSNTEENFKERRLKLYNDFKYDEYIKKENNRLSSQVYVWEQKYLQDEEFWELESLAIFLTQNPFEKYIEKTSMKNFSEVKDGQRFLTIGSISSIDKKTTKNKKQYAFIEFYTGEDVVELISWHDTYKVYSDIIKKDNVVICIGKKQGDDKIILEKMKEFKIWKEQMVKSNRL